MPFIPNFDSGPDAPDNPPPSGGGGGGAGGGSGGSGGAPAQPGPGAGPASLLSSMMFEINRLTADRTEYGPGLQLGPNDVVQVTPKRSNGAAVFISTMGNSDAKFSPRLQLAPTDNPVTVLVRSLREIGVYSTVVGEGVMIVVGRKA